MAVTLSRAQHTAIYTHQQNLIVVAGAGSGKTFVLVERYLALLDAHPDWRLNTLVAITFTQKAAQEMRDRVRQQLQKRVDEAEDDETRRKWIERLTTIDSARIDTIHGLCMSILRANAAEAGLDPQFVVLDETTADGLIDVAVEYALAEAFNSDVASHLFAEYTPRELAQTLPAFIPQPIVDIPEPEALFETWHQLWQGKILDFKKLFLTHTVFNEARLWGRDFVPNDASDKLVVIWQDFFQLAERLHDEHDPTEIYASLKSVHIALNVGSKKVWGEDAFVTAKDYLKTLRQLLKDAFDSIGVPPASMSQHASLLIPEWLNVIQSAQRHYQRLKQERVALDFDDLEQLTYQLLSDYPDVRDRYRGREIRHLLVDEFQDTNHRQWEIIRALASPEDAGVIFVVGDPKQSIYAFRGADVSVFEGVGRELLQQRGVSVALATSYRTHQTLVRGFNHIFSELMVRDDSSPLRDYQTLFGEPMQAHRLEAPDDAPPIEFLLHTAPDDADTELETDELRKLEASWIAERIDRLVQTENRHVVEKDTVRALDYGDIAILFQSTRHLTLYEEALKMRQIPYITFSGRGYYDRQEVWDVLNLLQSLHNPYDDLALSACLRSPIFNLSDEALLTLRWDVDAQGERLPLWDVLHALSQPILELLSPLDQTHIQRASRILANLRSIAGRVTVVELLRIALEQTGYLAVLTGLPDGARRRGNVEKLIEKARTSGLIGLGEFTRYLRDLTAREVREGEATLSGAGAVILMTVHASKGLEFPVVILADASRQLHRVQQDMLVHDPQIGFACRLSRSMPEDPKADEEKHPFAYTSALNSAKIRDEAERKRLLYVASTRAKDLLIVSGKVTLREEGEGYKLSTRGVTWLSWLLASLQLEVVTHRDEQIISQSWGDVRLVIHDSKPASAEISEPPLEWASVSMTDVEAPPLLAKVPTAKDTAVRSMTVLQVQELGKSRCFGPPESDIYARRWRHQALGGVGERVAQIRLDQTEMSARMIGQLVHRVIQTYAGVPQIENERLTRLLTHFTWDAGITDEGQYEDVIRKCRDILKHYFESEVYRWAENAKQIFRELPFTYKTEKRLIHGQIDVLMQTAHGEWIVVDYKTSSVRSPLTERAHARRYYLQAGVYARAVSELLLSQGIQAPVRVYIHYIRKGRTLEILPEHYENELRQLETYIGEVMGVEE